VGKFESSALKNIPSDGEVGIMRAEIDSYLYRLYRDMVKVQSWWYTSHSHLSLLCGDKSELPRKTPDELFKNKFDAVIVYSWVKTALEVGA